MSAAAALPPPPSKRPPPPPSPSQLIPMASPTPEIQQTPSPDDAPRSQPNLPSPLPLPVLSGPGPSTRRTRTSTPQASSSKSTLDSPLPSPTTRSRARNTGFPSSASAAAKSPASTPSHSPRRPAKAATAAASPSKHAVHPAPEATDRPAIARPYCFYPLNNRPLPPGAELHEPEPVPDDLYLHPSDDPGARYGIPIFKPTYEEFKQFDVYMETVRPWGECSSIVKIIPPKEWVDAVQLLDKRAMSQLEIRSPIEQRMAGQNGLFTQLNVERNRNHPLSIHEWFNKCRSHPDLVTPNPKVDDHRSVNRDSKEAIAQRAAAARAEKLAKKEKREAAAKRKAERDRLKAQAANNTEMNRTNDMPAVAENPDLSTLPPANDADTSMELDHPDDLPALDETSSHTSHSTGEPLATTPASDPVEPPIHPFYDEDWKKIWLPQGITPEDFDVAGCSRIENRFWKSLGTGKKDSWYGADLAGSLFADADYPWNVAHLPNLLNRLPKRLPGVNSPYLYFGMWRAAFSWHVEDMDLFSINYIHFGAPKLWYAVPQTEAERFESRVRSYFPRDANECGQFMRHKSCTVSPSKLHDSGIRVNKLVQYQNEFVITFPRGYHAGFNLGFNCAESVNFALPSWLELGKKAKACTCVDFSVRIDMDLLTAARDPTPEPEPVVKAEPEVERALKKRKSLPEEPGSAKRKKKDVIKPDLIKIKDELIQIKDEPSPSPVPSIKLVIRLPSPTKVLPISAEPKVAIVRETPPNPCVLCPSLSTEDLAPVFQPSDFVRSLSKTTAVQAHTSCAIALPEAWTEEVTISDDSGEDEHVVTYIKGLENIDKARWKLKCACCIDKPTSIVGTKVQCTKGKCVRAYHVPCARNNDEIVYFAGQRMIPGAVPNPETHEVETQFVLELLCPAHNPRAIETKKNKVAEQLRQKVLSIAPGAIIKYKSSGSSLEAQLIEIKEDTRKVVMRLPDFTVKEVAWSALDFRPSETKLLENEYAGPPKRSRKELEAPQPVFTSSPLRPHVGGYVPPNPAEYHGVPQMYPPTNAVVMVDSKHPGPPPPPPHHEYPYMHGPGPMVANHMRHLPPAVAYGPRVAVPPPRMLGYGPPPPRLAPAPPPHAPPHASPHGAPPHHRMMASSGGPPPSGAPVIGGWPPPGQRPSQPSQSPRQQPSGIPGGVGKIDLGLDRMMALMGKLPPMTVPALHLAGTNGKGSVSVILESCLNAAGMKTARYNSPHLLEPRDAIRINGQPASREEYARAIEHVQRMSDESNLGATTFEIGTAAAFLIANTASPPVDVLIVECGMGGLRDATNVMPPEKILASGLTSVGLDHTDRLGDTIAKIAREKASIVVPGGVIVVAPHLHPEALGAARTVAAERGAHIIEARPSTATRTATSLQLAPFREPEPSAVSTPLPGADGGVLHTHLGLGGAHQLDNLSLALTILDVVRNDSRSRDIQSKLCHLSDGALQAGVARARWQGRCAWLQWNSRGGNVPFLVDGAHNADSAATLRHYLDSLNYGGPRTFVLSLSASPGKTPEGVLRPLLRPGDRVVYTAFTTPVEGMPWISCATAESIRGAAVPLVGEMGQVHEVPGAGPAAVAAALEWAQQAQGLTVVCGSLYLVADAYRLVGAE